MTFTPDETAIDDIVASCDGDIRGALKALLLVNEQLEAELRQLYAATHGISSERPIRVPVEYVENPGKGRLGRLSRIRGKTADAGYMKRCVTLV